VVIVWRYGISQVVGSRWSVMIIERQLPTSPGLGDQRVSQARVISREEARRVPVPGGLLCLASLTTGTTRSSRLITRAWETLWSPKPGLVGSCRSMIITDHLDPTPGKCHTAKRSPRSPSAPRSLSLSGSEARLRSHPAVGEGRLLRSTLSDTAS
jgi:hypothetical protein